MVLNSRLARTFYIYQGNKEVVLGIHCYESGYYRECERTPEKAVEYFVSRSTLLNAKMTPSLRGCDDMPGTTIRIMERYTIARMRQVKELECITNLEAWLL